MGARQWSQPRHIPDAAAGTAPQPQVPGRQRPRGRHGARDFKKKTLPVTSNAAGGEGDRGFAKRKTNERTNARAHTHTRTPGGEWELCKGRQPAPKNTTDARRTLSRA